MKLVKFTITTIAILVAIQPRTLRADDDHLSLLRAAESAARDYRSSDKDEESKQEFKKQVETLVEKSFDARQIAQREQLERMQEKLRQAEIALNNRDEIRQRIISRKVEDLLSDQPADWKSGSPTEDKLFDVIAIGDTVAIYLEGVLPFTRPNQPPSPPQVNILKSGRIVTGFPFSVGSDGAVTLPLIGSIEIAGLSVREAEKKVRLAYINGDILRPEKSIPTITLIPREEATFSVLDAARGTPVAAAPPNEIRTATVTQSIAASVPSFDDTYGRISKAGELVRSIQSLEQTVASIQKRVDSGRFDSNNKPFLDDQLAELKMRKLNLQLERDYIDDVIEQLKTDLGAKRDLLGESEANLVRTEKLFATGALSSTAHGEARSQFTQQKAEYTKARQKLDQYEKISKRWNEIVGDTLAVKSDSKESVDKGTNR